jgi:hypothetical protein
MMHQEEEVMDFTKEDVHPLFRHMQFAMIRDDRLRREILKRRFSMPKEGEPFGFLYTIMDSVPLSEMNLGMFYKYLRTNQPVIVKDGCKDWPASERWHHDLYLIDQTKKTQASNYAHDLSVKDDLDVKLKNIESIKKDGLPGFNFSDGMLSLQNMWLNNNKILLNDF